MTRHEILDVDLCLIRSPFVEHARFSLHVVKVFLQYLIFSGVRTQKQVVFQERGRVHPPHVQVRLNVGTLLNGVTASTQLVEQTVVSRFNASRD